METNPRLSPTEFIAVINDTLGYNYERILIEGEVASFKVNQGKWVFFDLKDDSSNISCFMTLYQLRMPLEDGMKIVVRGTPKVTKWGKFSLTVDAIQPVGEGSIKKSFELLKQKLSAEGIFDPAKKRPIPKNLSKIGVISSTAAAGYGDFIKILNERWGGFKVITAHTQVQGIDAADQIIRALNFFNKKNDVDIIAIIRGGGSADDLSVFNDENLVRTIAASQIPVITGIGHEVDESLSDLAADVRASTPSNVAQLLTPDRHALLREISDLCLSAKRGYLSRITDLINEVKHKITLLEALNPEKVLRQGYAIISGKISPGNVVKITTFNQEINAEVKDVKAR